MSDDEETPTTSGNAPAGPAAPVAKGKPAPSATKPASAASPPKAPAKLKLVPEEKSSAKGKDDEDDGAPRAPKRGTLSEEERRLLHLRRAIDRRRPLFVRTAAHRYTRIGRWGSWRKPRGQQSKQRRHYGYRPTVVSIGFRTPAAVRGLTPAGFRPVLVRSAKELEELEPKRHAAIIAHGVGVRKRLVLEESARRRGLRVLNPILKEEANE